MRQAWAILGFVAALLLAAGGAQAAITMDTVTVGNVGNTGDPLTGYGAVAYTYDIGKYEVTAGQYTAFLNAVGGVDTYGLYSTRMGQPGSEAFFSGCNIQRTGSSGSYSYNVASDWANRPVNFVSWGDAARFANWLTNAQKVGVQNASTTEDGSYYLNGATTDAGLMGVTRKTVAQGGRYYIPTVNEWYKAAYYKGGGTNAGYWNYPTSSNTVPGRDMADASGNNANYYGSGDPIDSGKYTTVVGEFQNSESPYGTFDQGGNVWEWDEAILYGSSRDLRGGGFGSTVGYLLASDPYGYGPPTYESSSVGFRVSEVPEPATLSLLALGGLALIRHRRTA